MDKIKADLVFEILGRPAEHIKTALSSLIEKLGTEKGVKVIEKKIHEPTEVKESKDLYTTFSEVSVEFDSIENLFGITFVYMPAHVEIISPTNFTLTNLHLNELSNTILARLHNYDAIAKKLIYEKDFLVNKLREVAPQLFKKPEAGSENTEVKIDTKENQENKENSAKKETKSKK